MIKKPLKEKIFERLFYYEAKMATLESATTHKIFLGYFFE